MAQWDGRVHQRIADAIKKARGKRSAQWLADRTGELGHPISRAQIANYESGRKKGLDVVELVVLAAALEIPPLWLLVPSIFGSVEVLPDREVGGTTALGWLIGAGSQTVAGDARFAPNGVKTDSLMDIPLRLIQIELEWTRAMFDAHGVGEEDPDRFEMPEWMREVVREVGVAKLSRIENLEIERDTLVRQYVDQYGADGDGWVTSISIGSSGQITRRYQMPETSSDLYEVRDGRLTRLDDDDPRRDRKPGDA
ncbi:helix-turn-helix domain-containing protein [Mycobacteroides abscessus]|uniref:helix-turn-helix domain-containing protein n=1 Tax=Mycobacteroides abscessus TaxID=36809 RepID=UPI00266C94CD|nr:hypothetical protein [Mycobacteroides abscessus]MDO3177737.1 hypothetical protein [Mycobacteroides abscessus subsp. abscessus]